MLHRMSSAGAIGDVQIFGGCQAPAEPMLTQALNNDAVVIHQFFFTLCGQVCNSFGDIRETLTRDVTLGELIFGEF